MNDAFMAVLCREVISHSISPNILALYADHKLSHAHLRRLLEAGCLLPIKAFHDCCYTKKHVYCLCPKKKEPALSHTEMSQSSHNRQQIPPPDTPTTLISHQPLSAMFSQPKIT